jgi:hypothetical protein
VSSSAKRDASLRAECESKPGSPASAGVAVAGVGRIPRMDARRCRIKLSLEESSHLYTPTAPTLMNSRQQRHVTGHEFTRTGAGFSLRYKMLETARLRSAEGLSGAPGVGAERSKKAFGYNPSPKCLESPKPNSDRLAFVVQLPDCSGLERATP